MVDHKILYKTFFLLSRLQIKQQFKEPELSDDDIADKKKALESKPPRKKSIKANKSKSNKMTVAVEINPTVTRSSEIDIKVDKIMKPSSTDNMTRY